MTVHLTLEQKQMARRMKTRGMSNLAISKQIGASDVTIMHLFRGRKRPGGPETWEPTLGRLTVFERERSCSVSVEARPSPRSPASSDVPRRRSHGRSVPTEVDRTTESGRHINELASALDDPRPSNSPTRDCAPR